MRNEKNERDKNERKKKQMRKRVNHTAEEEDSYRHPPKTHGLQSEREAPSGRIASLLDGQGVLSRPRTS